MKKKHYHILKTFLNGAVALFFLSTPFWMPGNNIVCIPPAAAFAYAAVRNFKQIKESRDGENVYAPDDEDSIPEQIAYYKMYIYIAAIGCTILTIIYILDLNDFISGNQQRARLWGPVSFAYEHFGYWPAVFTTPFLGILLMGLGMLKIRSLKSTEQKNKG